MTVSPPRASPILRFHRLAPASRAHRSHGGVEDGEFPLEALRKELLEETGFVLDGGLPPHVWRREAPAPPELTSHHAVADDARGIHTAVPGGAILMRHNRIRSSSSSMTARIPCRTRIGSG